MAVEIVLTNEEAWLLLNCVRNSRKLMNDSRHDRDKNRLLSIEARLDAELTIAKHRRHS